MKTRSSALLAVLVLLVTVAPAGHAAVVAPARGTTMQATTAVYIRSGPSTAYPVIGTAAAGDTAMVLGGPDGEFLDVYTATTGGGLTGPTGTPCRDCG